DANAHRHGRPAHRAERTSGSEVDGPAPCPGVAAGEPLDEGPRQIDLRDVLARRRPGFSHLGEQALRRQTAARAGRWAHRGIQALGSPVLRSGRAAGYGPHLTRCSLSGSRPRLPALGCKMKLKYVFWIDVGAAISGWVSLLFFPSVMLG